jgi:hypothetical protein
LRGLTVGAAGAWPDAHGAPRLDVVLAPTLDRRAAPRAAAAKAVALDFAKLARGYAKRGWLDVARRQLATVMALDQELFATLQRELPAGTAPASTAPAAPPVGLLAGGEAIGEGWVVREDKAEVPRPEAPATYWAAAPARGDYRLSVEVMWDGRPGGAGLCFGGETTAASLVFLLQHDARESTCSFLRATAETGVATLLARTTALFLPTERADWIRIAVEVRGNRVAGLVDHHAPLECVVEDQAKVEGRVGLRVMERRREPGESGGVFRFRRLRFEPL